MTQVAVKLTAYNKDVQRYMMNGNRSSTSNKTMILEAIESAVISVGISFEKLFPSKSKRQAVLDEIIYYLSGSGICKVSAATLAEKTGASIRTVSSAVKSIKETGEIIVAGLADGKNKYIFVLKSHSNFESIMKEVFFVDIAKQNAEHIAEQDFSESVGTVRQNGQKLSSNHYNFINLKQEKESIQESIENDLQDLDQNTKEIRNKLQSYAANEYQLLFFDEIMSFPFPTAIKDAAGVLALRIGMDCDEKKVLKGMQLLNKIAINMVDGVEIRNVAAVFSEGINKPIQNTDDEEKQPQELKKVQFYNWLVLK